jgi:hypothetical protein
VPSDETTWSPRLQVYFQAIEQFHAKEKETPLGSLMVTNLSSLPSALTVIAIPDGDVKKHREDFIVNENLKRMGCAGRAATNIQPPQPSSIAKFHHLYRLSEAIPLYPSVMELVRICQTALVMYDKLQPTYVDGLLCDVTEQAITNWWTDIGTYFYNVEPNDGIFGPTTVAALLGLLIGAYNRLKASGSPVGKDVLDMASMKRAIGHFQKTQKVERSRRLDRETLDRLHRATAKNAAGEGWTVPKAVKSTVAELSGKGGEMVMGIVGARDKAGISDAETMDIERFSQLVQGPKMKWLWHGKAVKSSELFKLPDDPLNGRVFSTDDQGNFFWTTNRHDSLYDRSTLERSDTVNTNQSLEGKTGRGRIRGAVGGLKAHGPHRHKDVDENHELAESATTAASGSARDMPHRVHAFGSSIESVKPEPLPPFDMALAAASTTASGAKRGRARRSASSADLTSHRQLLKPPIPGDSPRRKKIIAEMAGLRDEFKADVYQNFSAELPYKGLRSRALRRSQSSVQIQSHAGETAQQERLTRHNSFGMVQRAVLNTGESVIGDKLPSQEIEGDPTNALAEREAFVAEALRKAKRIQLIQQGLIPYTEDRVSHVENLESAAQQHVEQLNGLYYHRLDEYQSQQATSSDIISREKSELTEGFRRVEMLGAKLDYELDALQSRMQEVEDGVDDFERNVAAIEAKVRQLIGDENGHSAPWFQRIFGAIGSKK